MEKTRAWEMLNNPDHASRLTVIGIQELMLRAGYPADVVQKAMNERGMERLTNNMKV